MRAEAIRTPLLLDEIRMRRAIAGRPPQDDLIAIPREDGLHWR